MVARSDEIFTKAILDNNYDRWESISSSPDNTADQWRLAMYTSDGRYSGAKRNQRWSIESIKQ
eukprot:2577144-Ditylum_brightwellii.AAC.1